MYFYVLYKNPFKLKLEMNYCGALVSQSIYPLYLYLYALNININQMFTVYKKIISPESSPVLGPASPNITPMPDANNNANNNGAMESLSLCNCCCSTRNKIKDPIQDPTQDPIQDPIQDPTQDSLNPKYEFGHATHYVYGVTSPRLLCEFETGTIP
jgi:hypothetical protein